MKLYNLSLISLNKFVLVTKSVCDLCFGYKSFCKGSS